MAAYLLDTNILLRICDGTSATHLLAIQATNQLLAQGHTVHITSQNLIEFWAVATRPIAANGLGLTVEQTATEVEQYINRFPLLEDSAAIFTNWLLLVKAYGVQGKRVHDTRLVAVMLTHGITHMLTFNIDDFKGYTAIAPTHPTTIT